MAQTETFLITGVSGFWGSRLAARLVNKTDCHIIGLDVSHPVKEIPGLDFVQADIRNPLLVDLLKEEKVDTVCHLTFRDTTQPRQSAFDLNVLGTIKLLEACAEAGVGKVILKSSTAVYGAHPDNSAFLTEERPLRGSREYGYTRDMIEIETYCNGFRHQSPEVKLTILRFPNIIGPTVDSPIARFLKGRWTPGLLGFDPLMQLIHQDDVVEALVHASRHEASGVFNVAADDAMPLNKIRGMAGKPPISVLHPLAYWGVGLLGASGLGFGRWVPIELDYIRYPWVADLTKMHDVLAFEPYFTAEEALREFIDRLHMDEYEPESPPPGYGEERLHDSLKQRRRQRDRQAAAAPTPEEGQADD